MSGFTLVHTKLNWQRGPIPDRSTYLIVMRRRLIRNGPRRLPILGAIVMVVIIGALWWDMQQSPIDQAAAVILPPRSA